MYSCAISAFFIFILILSRLRIVKILSSTSKLFRFFFFVARFKFKQREQIFKYRVFSFSRFFFFILNLTILVVGNRKKKTNIFTKLRFIRLELFLRAISSRHFARKWRELRVDSPCIAAMIFFTVKTCARRTTGR